MTRATLGWIAAVLVASGAAARADERPETRPAAKPFLNAGVAAYSAGDYEKAAREFEFAYKIDPQPAVLYAWAQSLRLGNRCSEAIALYRRYLATEPNEAQTAAAQSGISRCEEVRSPELVTEAESPLPEPPPPDRIEPVPAPEGRQPRAWYADPVGGALVIGGAVSLGIGAGLLVRSSQNRDAAGEATRREDFIDLLDTATLQRRIGAVGLGLGAALVTGGVIRYVTRPDRSRTAAIAISGRSLVIHGRF